MLETSHGSSDADSLMDLADTVSAQVRDWLRAADTVPEDTSAARLAGLLRDPAGLPFAVGFIDGVIRPEDERVAAANFAALSAEVPAFLPRHLRAAVRLGAAAGRIAPQAVIPVVRRVLRRMVGHLVIDASDRQVGRAIARLRATGVRLNVNLLGEAVLGEHEAGRRLQGTYDLLARADVDYVSIKVSSVIGPHPPWAFEQTVENVVEKLTPLFRLAASASPAKFVNLDMEEYHDLDLTVAVFTRLLDQPELRGLQAGIVLQAYLPDALAAMIGLQEWAARRRRQGGAAVKVRLVKGANLPMERVDAQVHGWPLATWASKQASDTNYKRILHYALRPERIENVRIGVAGHNLFDIAFAWHLAGLRGARSGVEFEMLLGMAPRQAAAVQRTVGGLLLYTPVVHPREFDVAIAYLIRRLEEGATSDNFMSAVFELANDVSLFEREQERFRASLRDVDDDVPAPNRRQDRRAEQPRALTGGFQNAPDTDPSLPGNRQWAAGILASIPHTAAGLSTVRATTVTTARELDEQLDQAVTAGKLWGAQPVGRRAEILRRAAVELEQSRAELCEVMGAECGKTLDQADPEVSEAVDFANYYAYSAEQLDNVDGATHVPVRVTVVTPPWNFPVSISAGSILGPLAAGSAVVIKPAPQARRCGAVVAEALWRAGVPRDVLRMVQVSESDLGERLVSDPRVDRLILTGAYETAELFRSFRADLPLLAETSGKNAIIVTPSADYDLAVKDIVYSAFAHAGQKCSAASLAVLVGSVAESPRFEQQLRDAVTSLRVGDPSVPTTQMGPLIEPARGKLLGALTQLDAGESWLVEPQRLDEEGRLWSPGVRVGVSRGSAFHRTEYFGPVLGLIRAETLEEAVDVVNEVDYGLTSGLHSLDSTEIDLWLRSIQAGNLYVNRGTTGAIVRRQPFGGWKKSAVGAGTKAGGPNYLIGLCDWQSAKATSTHEPPARVRTLVRALAQAGASADDLAFLERSIRSDAQAWADEFGRARDVSRLELERNVFRYLPGEVVIRNETGAPLAHLVRVIAAGVRAGSRLTVSTATDLPPALRGTLTELGVAVTGQSRTEWISSATRRPAGRVRLIGEAYSQFTVEVSRPDLAVYGQPVTEAGRIEMLPFLHEQAVSITAHRFGTPDHLSDHLL